MFYRLSGLILNRFNGNIVFMLTSGLHKMLNVLTEIIVQIFRDIDFLSAFLFVFPFVSAL